MHVLILSKDHLDLAEWEAKELLHLSTWERTENLLLLETITKKAENLGFTKKIMRLIHRCPKKSLEETFSTIPFEEYFKETFSLRIPEQRSKEKELASIIWDALKKPKVDLKNATTKFEIHFTKKEAFVCILQKELKQGFEERKSHKRVAPHPSSLHPKLARAMVNMLGTEDEIVDPFCGSGGLLIEAGLTGHRIIGYDIDEAMLERATANLHQYKLTAKLKQRDATLIKKIPYLVTDLPYGRNTRAPELTTLYDEFFKDLVFKKAVVGFPDFIRCKKILKKHNITIVKEFPYYLHKSLKKKILVLTT